eukprot:GHVT01095389.1.p1 GENE.GHVT01095389.1~~GHVT01095389.1.p1  ORF type:complete len:243 (-),score=17.28 GHVT01095389.1:1418-2146(-)
MEDFNDWTSMKKNIAELREAVRGLNGNQQFGQRGAQTTDRSKTVDVPDAETETPNYPGVDALQHEQAAAEDRVSQFVRTAGAATASRILKIPSSDGAEEASDLGVPSTDDREEPSTLADVTTLPSSIRRELKKCGCRATTELQIPPALSNKTIRATAMRTLSTARMHSSLSYSLATRPSAIRSKFYAGGVFSELHRQCIILRRKYFLHRPVEIHMSVIVRQCVGRLATRQIGSPMSGVHQCE